MSENKSSGFLFLLLGLLTICFVVLKLVGVIAWSWLWVLCPIWGFFAIIFTWAIVLGIILAIADIGDK